MGSNSCSLLHCINDFFPPFFGRTAMVGLTWEPRDVLVVVLGPIDIPNMPLGSSSS